MKTKRITAAASMLILLAGLTACASDPGEDEAPEDQITVRYAALGPSANDVFGLAVTAWQEEVTEKSGGRVQFENYWSASLLGATDMLTGLQTGVADLGWFLPNYYAEQLPVNTWLSGMGAAVSSDPTRAVVASGAVAYEQVLGDTAARAEYESQGLTPLIVTSSLPYHLLCTKEVSSVADAQGLSARSSGEVWTTAVEQLGMTGVSMPFTELYEALQRGVVDCAIAAVDAYPANGWDEVAKHFVPVTLPQVSSTTWAWNKDFWDSLDPEIHQIMQEATSTFFEVSTEQYLKRGADALEGILGDGGSGVIASNPNLELLDIADKHRQAWVNALPAQAPDAVDDPEQIITNYQARLQHWYDAMDELGIRQEPTDVQSMLEAYAHAGTADLTELFRMYDEEIVSASASRE